MRKDHHQVPQIKPESILDPHQIKFEDDNVPDEDIHDGDISGEKPKKSRSKFKFPKLKEMRININPKNMSSKGRKRFFIIITSLSIFILLVVFFLVIPVVLLAKNAFSIRSSINTINAAVDSQDIGQIKSALGEFKGDFSDLKGNYKRLSWSKHVPFIGAYYKDGEAVLNAGDYGLDSADIVIEAIEPYADIIGMGQGNGGGDNANDRIEFLVQSIEHILPKTDELAEKSGLIHEELSKIDPKRYPVEFRGKPVRAKIKEYLAIAEGATEFLSESTPLLESSPHLLGLDGTRTYLLLFQNDKELRPTGGFITAYSIIKVTNGKIEPGDSSDIYKLDENYTPNVKAPDEMRKYIKGPYTISDNFYLRDMNWNPDFKEAMDLFLREARSAGIPEVDGIIAVDTQVVVNLLDAIGPVNVPDFGVYSSAIDERCACPQVVYELESFADVEGPVVWSENEPGKIVFAPPNYLNRKEIVGPLMNTILTSSLGQPVEKMPELFNAAWKSLTEKHILFYLLDGKAQEGAEAFGIAGRVKDYDSLGELAGYALAIKYGKDKGGNEDEVVVVATRIVESRSARITKTCLLLYDVARETELKAGEGFNFTNVQYGTDDPRFTDTQFRFTLQASKSDLS